MCGLALLLLLLLQLLHLLLNLLRQAAGRGGIGREAWTDCLGWRRGLLLRGRRRFVLRIVRHILVVFFRSRAGWAGGCLAGVAFAEDDLARNALSAIADHHDVVAGALQQLREDVVRRAGSEVAEDALVAGKAFDFRSCCGRDVGEDLVKA